MSWFWRMPSMLARSLMRDVAAAVVTAQASIASAASAIRDVPSISCSPRGRTKEHLPFACQRVRLAKPLREKRNGRGGGAGAARGLAGRRQYLPAQPVRFYRPLTITAHLCRMRVQGPNGTAISSAPGPAAARQAPSGTFTVSEAGTPQAQTPAVALRTLGGIDALIALQGIEDPVERRQPRG